MNLKVYTTGMTYLFTVRIADDYWRWMNDNVWAHPDDDTACIYWKAYQQFIVETGIDD